MRLLLDTCAFLWALHEPKRLSTDARQALEHPGHAIEISVISFWEISIKTGLGKLSLEGVTPEEYPSLAKESGWEIQSLDPTIAASVGRLHRSPDHRDPFDRLLVWTAVREGLTLVSADSALRVYLPHGLKICW